VIDVSYNTKVADMSRFHLRKLQSKRLGLLRENQPIQRNNTSEWV
jgi:hypothetical protein